MRHTCNSNIRALLQFTAPLLYQIRHHNSSTVGRTLTYPTVTQCCLRGNYPCSHPTPCLTLRISTNLLTCRCRINRFMVSLTSHIHNNCSNNCQQQIESNMMAGMFPQSSVLQPPSLPPPPPIPPRFP